MGTIRTILDTVLRVILFLAAAGAMLLVCGGVGWFVMSGGNIGRQQAQVTPSSTRPVAKAMPLPSHGNSVEDIVVGFYLKLRQGDIDRAAGQSDASVTFTIESGETAASVAAHLAEAGLITDPDLFSMYMRYNRLDSTLEAGNYALRANMTMPEVALSLQHGQVDEVVFTVPEGWRVEQVAELLGANGIADEQQFVDYVRGGISQEGITARFPFLRERPPGAPTSVDGFLFPDTYRVPVKSDIKTIVDIMLSNFARRFNKDLQQAAQQQNKTVYEVVTLAAIVEREAVMAEERPIIASVYLNRLAQGKALESDPTVQYALGYQPESKQWWKTPLPLEDLVGTDSVWSTYLHPGLPPGPICNPGLSALEAVVKPAQTDYLFFYSKGDGSHAFAATWEEHLKNQERYRQ